MREVPKKICLAATPAESDLSVITNGTGVLVVKCDIPQVFIPLPDATGVESTIKIDPNSVNEITKTTKIFFGKLVGSDFFPESKLFPLETGKTL